jgi:integrating conjugative element protein (TIGR03746 family)
MSAARNKLLASADHIFTLRLIVSVLLMVVIAQWWRVGSLQESRRLYIPPDLSQGVLTQLGTVPEPVVYTFAYYIFQQLHRWKTNGEQDYPAQIYKLQGFLTPDCINTLTEDMANKNKRGELRSRTRMMQEIVGRSYQPRRVSIESKNAWRVWIDTNIRETIEGHPVKNVNVQYPLRVVKFDVDREINPWGLAIACDQSTQPTLLTDIDIEAPFSRKALEAVN